MKKEEKNDKMKLINNNSTGKMNKYINSILIPFIVKSFDFIKSLTTMNNTNNEK